MENLYFRYTPHKSAYRFRRTRSRRKRHLPRKTRVEFNCEYCSEEFHSKVRHVAAEVWNILNGKEVNCAKRTKIKKFLILSDTDHTGTHLWCHCSFVFKLTFHQQNVCFQELLDEHKSTHSGDDKPYKCQFCGKGFKNRYHVRDHENTHTDTAEFKCNVCEKVQKDVPLKYLRSVHTQPQSARKCSCQFFFENAWWCSHCTVPRTLRWYMYAHGDITWGGRRGYPYPGQEVRPLPTSQYHGQGGVPPGKDQRPGGNPPERTRD